MNTMQRTAKRFKKSEWRDIMPKQSTTEEFVYKARKIHGDKYDYSKSVYTRSCDKVIIICKEHGEFLCRANDHLYNKTGCSKCAKQYAPTTEEFIDRAKKVHGDRYDYSKSVYAGTAIKLTVICKKHGEFFPTPANHCNGSGCKKCGYESNKISLSVSQEEFIKRATQIHKNKYDYSVAVYTKGRNKIKIICPKHGEFLQKANSHLYGKGCMLCRNERNTNTTDEFINLAKKIHGDKYDYSKTVYIGCKTRIVITCSTHGDFEQFPTSHVGKGNKNRCGCPQCYLDRHKTSTEKLVKECKKIHKNFYDYSKTEYIDSDTKIKIICPTHGVFSQLPFNDRAGQGCKKCTLNVSNKETKFLDEIKIPKRSRQKRIKKYLVDGVHKNVVYEFLGDYWHGNPLVHKRGEVNRVTKTTFGELYVATFKKFKTLHGLGYTVKYIWELDWDNWIKTKSTPLKIHEYKNH